MGLYDNLINGTFNSLGSNATSGWTTPQQSYQPGMMGRGQPYGSDRLSPTWTPSLAAIQAAAPTGGGGSSSALGYSPTAMGGYPTVADYGPASTAMEDALIAAGVKPGVSMSQQGWGAASLPGMVPGAQPIPRAAAGSPTSSGQGGLIDWLGSLFGGTNAGSLLKNLSPDTFYGIGEGMKGGGNGLLSLLRGGMSNRVPGAAIPFLAGDSAAAAAAKASGRNAYTDANNMLMPTVSIGGKSRQTYGDAGGGSSGGKGSWATGETSGSPFW